MDLLRPLLVAVGVPIDDLAARFVAHQDEIVAVLGKPAPADAAPSPPMLVEGLRRADGAVGRLGTRQRAQRHGQDAKSE